jgi:GT2 family glycosyltransferase
MSPSKVYIIIVNYKQWQDTQDCLHSILQSSYSHYSIFVIDNNSGNRSLENLSQWLHEKHAAITQGHCTSEELPARFRSGLSTVNLIQHDNNAGFAKANNLVLNLIRKEDAYVWLLNPDMVVAPETLENLVSFAGRQSTHSIIGSVVKEWEGNQEPFFYGGGKVNFTSATISMADNQNSSLDFISGGNLFTLAQTFNTLGLLPDNYFLYWEETDWCYAAKQKGYQLLVCYSAICYDKISTVIGKGFLADYYYARNGLHFVAKFHKSYLWLAIPLMGARWLKRVFTGKWDRAKGVCRGTIDYLKHRQYEIQ